jgi:hypothetical protein
LRLNFANRQQGQLRVHLAKHQQVFAHVRVY